MKNLTLFIIVVLWGLPTLLAQNTVLSPATEKVAPIDSVRVLVIPYNPRYYLSDSDKDIADASNRSVEAIRQNFRLAIDKAVIGSLYGPATTRHYSHSLLSDTTADTRHDLQRIYATTGYRYDAVPVQKAANKGQFAMFRKKKLTADTPMDEATAVHVDNNRIEDRYMNAVIADEDLIPYLATKYEKDVFVFITQFELRINFNDCLDLARKVYQREIKVHYSVYNHDGRQIGGNYVKVVFPSNYNNQNEIIVNYFPLLAQSLLDKM